MINTNIRSLAKELKLSIGTVSKALKDSHEISDATKQRVLELAEKLHYNPNPYASSLRRKKSNTIAVVVPEVADSFFSLAIKGIEEIAQSNGYHVLIYLTYESYLKEKKILGEFRNGRVDGILISVSSETLITSHITDLNLPIVFFDRVIEEMQMAKVTTNDRESSFKATKHLVESGCKNIVYLSISKNLAINNERIEGYKKAVLTSGITWDESKIINCSNDADDNEKLLLQLLKRKDKPDGIIAGVEKLVVPVYSVSKELKLKIPSQLKVICFSNSAVAHILNPSLTTVTQPAYEMGKMAASVLFKSILRKEFTTSNEQVILSSELLVRESTGGV